ncbi:hypothetical protein SAMN04488107_1266 [Geodermatophilus saharensis]|uniref:Uncharacterized protein n=1 Tax=Geodermatophilus saharensis TaxID=1137994 RepID=A0A239BM96_9ACTN|nr:hypothetical protein [Geodermatophilus saharensis]SNS08468.1 hypothetical protein SAMN04488107_1266 [Geodermatophilus saharensis]
MGKRQIARLFVGSLLAVVAGLALMALGGGLAIANDVLVTRGPDVVGVDAGAGGWVLIALAIVGVLVLLAAGVGLLVAWVAALVVTARLEDKTWFLVLLVTGLVSLGIVGMVLYLVAGPDDQPARPPAQPWTAGAGR